VILEIIWNVKPELIEGWKTPNKYGILFVTGLILGYFVIKRMFRKEHVPEDKLDKLLIYMVVATIIGARLGHVFFYDWAYYKNHLSEIPAVWKGGLASHGAAIAILIALWFYSKNVVRKPMLWTLDRVSAPIAIAGCFIRLGNLMNSEIVGTPTNLPWAFSFPQYFDEVNRQFDATPRHPAQLYEAIAYLLIFATLFYMYWKTKSSQKPGMIFGVFLIGIWGMRFLIEFIKEGQTARDFENVINTGQMLSIPFVLFGIYLIVRAAKMKPQIG
jgi:phosphatidylglycerol---prolipoprotein diacylglyceryl transferase